jgi:heptosyltransferase II
VKEKKQSSHFIVYLIYRGAVWFLTKFPVTWTFRFGQIIGTIGYCLLPKYRKLGLHNLGIAFPENNHATNRRILFRHFQTLTANLLCSTVLLQKPWNQAARYIDSSEFENLVGEKSITSSRVWAINHIGNWELFIFSPHWVKGRAPMATIYQRLSNPFLDRHTQKHRESNGVIAIDRSDGLPRSANLVKSGGSLGILIDQHAGDQGVWIPFFGKLASTTSFPALLARKTHTDILCLTVATVDVARWKVQVSGIIETKNISTEEATLRATANLEQQIRKNPSDWFWLHNRWKTPNPNFLLRQYRRGIYTGAEPLKPFKVLIWLPEAPEQAKESIEAVRRIKQGRPDLHLTVFTLDHHTDPWKTVAEIDQILLFHDQDSSFKIASQIRQNFDVAILFSDSRKAAWSVWLARIPRRVGILGQHHKFLLNQFVRPEKSSQPNNYLKIAERLGAF